ncbi:MAG: hypothetical protein QM617_01975 [Comamonas sp.]
MTFDRHTILSALITGVLAYLITLGIQRLSKNSQPGSSRWLWRTLTVALVFIAALGARALIG